jgi:hypothetical protein
VAVSIAPFLKLAIDEPHILTCPTIFGPVA